MPLYDIRCDTCGGEREIFRSLAEYDDLPDCCGEPMHRVIRAPRIIQDIQPYRSTITGEVISTRDAHRNHLKQHGCIEIGNEPIRPRKTHWADEKVQTEARAKEIRRAIDQVKTGGK